MIKARDGFTLIPVLALGKGWIAVNKPAGMTVHNAPGKDLCTVVYEMIEKNPSIQKSIQPDPVFRLNPVHRLDKEASGVILLAGNREVFRFFSKQFECGKVKKRYIALVHGLLQNPENENAWKIWQWPLSQTAGGRNNPQGPGKRVPAETRYRGIACSRHYTLVEVELITGRTHQIRRHTKLAGHPLTGDARYGSSRAAGFLKSHFSYHRLGLHANCLTIALAEGKTPETIATPDIPDEMKELFEKDCLGQTP